MTWWTVSRREWAGPKDRLPSVLNDPSDSSDWNYEFIQSSV